MKLITKLRNFFEGIQTITINKTKILLENSAVGFSSDFSKLFMLLENLKSLNFFSGICLDTAHVFQSGYDITNKDGIDRLIKDLVNPNLIKVIHLNDSKSELGSRIDRHEHIGQGYIGLQGFRIFLSQKIFKDIPIILETPRRTIQDDIRNLRTVEKLLASLY